MTKINSCPMPREDDLTYIMSRSRLQWMAKGHLATARGQEVQAWHL